MAGLAQRFGGGRRLMLLAAAAVAVALVWGVSHWASAPVYVTLFRDLEFKQSSEIEDSLGDAGIPFRLDAGGTEVLVPVSEVAKARVALAKDGHSMGGRPGLELFDKPSWGMTDFAQRVTYQRALEGELARTIAGIRGLERAQVHLAIPAPGALRSLDRQATASVVLSMENGMTLSAETIQGITYVVSNSVEQLAAEDVAVMDDSGKLLSVPAGERSESAATSRQIEIQHALEASLVQKIQDLLAPVVGANSVRAEVAVQMSFDKVDRAVEKIGPASAPATEGEVAFPNDVSAREYQRSEGSVGKLTKLTAAVLINEKDLGSAEDAADSLGSGLRLSRIEAMIGDAIGIDPERGDRLTVASIPFEETAPPELADETEVPGTDIIGLIERILRPVIGLVAVIFLALLALKVLRLAPAAAPAPPAVLQTAGDGGLREIAGGGGGTAPGAAQAERPEANLQVVRKWLKES